jgi:hypothetical protein
MAGGGGCCIDRFWQRPFGTVRAFPCSTTLAEHFPFATAEEGENNIFGRERQRAVRQKRDGERNRWIRGRCGNKRAPGWEARKCAPILCDRVFRKKWEMLFCARRSSLPSKWLHVHALATAIAVTALAVSKAIAVEACRVVRCRGSQCLDSRVTDVSPSHRPHSAPEKHCFYALDTHFC